MKKLLCVLLMSPLIVLAGDKAETVTLSVSGMDCSGCSPTVKKAVSKVDGVADPVVNYEEAQVTFKATNAEAKAKAIASLKEAGFEATVK